jgi:hypothetical protein
VPPGGKLEAREHRDRGRVGIEAVDVAEDDRHRNKDRHRRADSSVER